MSQPLATISGRPAPPLAHHFESMKQQHDSAVLGMWVFLLTEILLFSGLFVGYAVYRALHPEVFQAASQLLDWRMGMLNTFVLLTSSLTMALAVRAAQLGRHRQLALLLASTLALAGVFLVVKYFEYSHKLHRGIAPGFWFSPHGAEAAGLADLPYARNFFSIYFVMTALHGIHVLIGMAAIGWLLARARRQDFGGEYYYPVECVGLYWHLVDLVWIYLFPLLYLID